jgi:large subunit ribosomal protein L6
MVSADGPKGKLSLDLPPLTTAKCEGNLISVSRSAETAEARSMHGLARALINNMVTGVSVGFQKKLEIQGVGFKAAVSGDNVNLTLGYSHPIIYTLPAGVRVVVEENTKLTIDGPSKEAVGRVAAELRSYYPPEPYKGKGVRYSDEKVKRKEGKTVQ